MSPQVNVFTGSPFVEVGIAIVLGVLLLPFLIMLAVVAIAEVFSIDP